MDVSSVDRSDFDEPGIVRVARFGPGALIIRVGAVVGVDNVEASNDFVTDSGGDLVLTGRSVLF